MELLDESARGFIHNLCGKLENNNKIPPEYYDLYSVKRGLRNADGTGVVARDNEGVQRTRLPHQRGGAYPA